MKTQENLIKRITKAPHNCCPYPMRKLMESPGKWWCGNPVHQGEEYCRYHERMVVRLPYLEAPIISDTIMEALGWGG